MKSGLEPVDIPLYRLDEHARFHAEERGDIRVEDCLLPADQQDQPQDGWATASAVAESIEQATSDSPRVKLWGSRPDPEILGYIASERTTGEARRVPRTRTSTLPPEREESPSPRGRQRIPRASALYDFSY